MKCSFLYILKLKLITYLKIIFLFGLAVFSLCNPQKAPASNLSVNVKNCFKVQPKQNNGCIIHQFVEKCNNTCLNYRHPLSLRLTDNQALTPSDTLCTYLTIPSRHPICNADKSYIVALSDLESLTLNGSTSYEPDEAWYSSDGNICSDDIIIIWDWDFNVTVKNFDETCDEIVTIDWKSMALYFSSKSNPISLPSKDQAAISNSIHEKQAFTRITIN